MKSGMRSELVERIAIFAKSEGLLPVALVAAPLFPGVQQSVPTGVNAL